MSHYISARQTGRSTRAWERAISIAESGEMVLYITHSCNEAKRLRKLNNPESLKIRSVEQVNTDYNLFDIIRNSRYPCMSSRHHIVVVDHYAIETHFAAVLEELHRYDK